MDPGKTEEAAFLSSLADDPGKTEEAAFLSSPAGDPGDTGAKII
jgi:hypothetical protein